MQLPTRTLAAALGALTLLAATAGSALANETTVTQKDKTFLPGEVKIRAGDTIVFKNDDPITHNMFSRSKNHEFNLKMQKPGEDMRQSFEEPGTAVVRCAIHPKMKLVVHVEE